jgi:phage major head subunit gpT-like protein
MQDKSNTVLRDAQHIAGSPEDHIDDPALFTTAWAAMKAARGQGFDPLRLRPQHLIDRPTPSPEPIDQTLNRVGETVRSYAAKQGYRVRCRHAA